MFSLAIIFLFVVGYVLISLEQVLKLNKAMIALMLAVLLWILQFTQPGTTHAQNLAFLNKDIGINSQIVFFLLGALVIIETISSHHGFSVLAKVLRLRSKKKMLWAVGLVTFFLSAVLDNLTTTLVMISLLKEIIEEGEDRWVLGAVVVIAANAGGAWTPIGDVTTTMLWIGGQLTAVNILSSLFLPSVACLLVSLAIFTVQMKGEFKLLDADRGMGKDELLIANSLGSKVLFLGIFLLIFVPIFKLITGLPPFMGMMFALSTMWLVTDLLHVKSPHREHLLVPAALARVDLTSTFFFLGILLSVNVLEVSGILAQLTQMLMNVFTNPLWIAGILGIVSAIIDNVPLVAASMGMFSLEQYATDNALWGMIAYAAGTGGSILIIGSAAGIVFMALERVSFFWYVRRVTLPALLGYIAGILVYLLQRI